MMVIRLSPAGRRILAMVLGLCLLGGAAACSPAAETGNSGTPPPPGDVERGAMLFTQSINGAPACSTCHALDSTTLVGPGMEGYGARAGSQVSGMSAEEYTAASIIRPASYITPNFSNLMYNNFGSKLSAQDLADLVAYSLSL